MEFNINKTFPTSSSDEFDKIERFKKSAIAYLFSDPNLDCIVLSGQDYMDGQIAYRSQHNEQELMLSAIHREVSTQMPAQEHYNILSIGCGSGLFEQPFITKLLSQHKSIHFVGIDPNKEECNQVRQWGEQLQVTYPEHFSFEVMPVGLEDFQDDRVFDLVLVIHTMFYLSDVKSAIYKSYERLKPSGMTIIAISKRRWLNEPFCYILQRYFSGTAWFSKEIHQALVDFNISFHQEDINFLVNITQCFQADSKLGIPLLNFMLGVSVESFLPLQLQLLKDYFAASSSISPDGDILLPHSGTLFYLQKKN